MPKPNGPCFDQSWIKRSRVRNGTIEECKRFFHLHYLHCRPAVVPLILTVEVDRYPAGMVCFALPPKETNKRYETTVWELARLWLEDQLPTNAETWVIGQAVKYVKKHHPTVGMLISYADPSAGHEGVMYRAANWKSDGMTDDNRKTARFDYTIKESTLFGDIRRRYSRAGHLPADVNSVERLPRVSKRRFIYRLDISVEDVVPTSRRPRTRVKSRAWLA